MVKVGDGLDLLLSGLNKMTKKDIQKRLNALAMDELNLFSQTRDADYVEQDAISRAMDRNYEVRKRLRQRLKELENAVQL